MAVCWAQASAFPMRRGSCGWAVAFGEEFAQAFPEAALRAAGFAVDTVGETFLLRLTDDLADVKTRYEAFQERREAATAPPPEVMFKAPPDAG